MFRESVCRGGAGGRENEEGTWREINHCKIYETERKEVYYGTGRRKEVYYETKGKRVTLYGTQTRKEVYLYIHTANTSWVVVLSDFNFNSTQLPPSL